MYKLRLGNKIQQIRADKKLSQAEMADLLKISSSSYSRLERGDGFVNIDELPAMASALGVSVQELLPETLSISNNSHNHQGGMVFGNIVNNYNSSEKVIELEKKIGELTLELAQIKEILASK